MKKAIITKEDEKYIVDSYLKGVSILGLTKEIHTNGSRIKDVLINNNISIRKRGEQVDKQKYITNKKYKYNENFFETIDTEEKAYWLGFIYADGNVYFPKSDSGNSKGGRVEITLKKEDSYHLYNFVSAINGNLPLKEKTIKLNGKTYYATRVSISSVKMASDLHNIGCVANKSLILKFPSNFPKELLSNFIRGYFDGDGCVHFYPEKKCKSFGMSILGTLDFLNGLKDVLLENNIDSVSIFRKKNNVAYDLHVYGIDNLNRLFNFLYSNNCFYIERKYKIFTKALSYYNKDYYRSELCKMVSQMDWCD